jgi:hypothetical protein
MDNTRDTDTIQRLSKLEGTVEEMKTMKEDIKDIRNYLLGSKKK